MGIIDCPFHRIKITDSMLRNTEREQMSSGPEFICHYPTDTGPCFHALEPGLDLAPLTNIRRQTGTEPDMPLHKASRLPALAL